MIKRFCLHITLFLLFNVGWGQKLTHYGIQNGLSNMEVTDICQGDIFLWIATRDGLNRFDGKNFTVFKRDNSANSLYNNNIETLAYDSRGWLWIGYKSGGASIYNPRTDSFTHLSRFIKEYPHRVVSIYEDSQNNIWLGTWEQGVYKICPKFEDGVWSMMASHHLNSSIVSAIIEKPTGKIWFGTFNGIITHDLIPNAWTNFSSIQTDTKNIVVARFYDNGNENMLWCGSWDRGLTSINLSEQKLNAINFQHSGSGKTTNIEAIHTLVSDQTGKLIVGTWGQGLFSFDPREKEPNYELHEHPQVTSPIILSSLKDHYQDIYIGTDGDGLYRFTMDNNAFTVQSPGDKETESNVFSLSSDDNGRIWIGTKNEGFYLYDLENQSKNLSYKSLNKEQQENNISSFYHDSKYLLVGHDGNGFYMANMPDLNNKSSKRLNIIHKNKTDVAKITCIKKDSENTIWLGTKQEGLKYIHYDSLSATDPKVNSCKAFKRNRITDIEHLEPSKLWVSTYNGLYLYNQTTKKIEGQYLQDDIVYSMSPVEQDKTIWLGLSSGLSKIEYKDSLEIKTDLFENVLPKGSVYNTVLDEENNLWFTISNRLFYIDHSANTLKEIHLGKNKAVFTSVCKKQINGIWYLVFGSNQGLLILDPAHILQEEYSGKLVFTNLQIDYNSINVGDEIHGQKILSETAPYTKHLTIPYLHKWLTFSFTEISPGIVLSSHKYKLEGFSDAWYDLNSSKSITFSQLEPDDYKLFVSKDGKETQEAILTLTITPPWWKTTKSYVFFVIGGIVFMALALFLVDRHMRKKQREEILLIEKEKSKELLNEKVNFFTELSHDLLTPLTLIVAPVKDLLKQKGLSNYAEKKLKIVQQNAHYLTDIFSNILDFKKVEVKDLKLVEKKIEIVSFLKTFITAFDYLAKSKNIVLDYHSSIPSLEVIIDTVKLERIIFNLLSNAFKFTDAGKKISISLDYHGMSKQSFCFTIQDGGTGIKKEALPNVFDKFYQEESTNKNQGIKGRGLGLYIINQFVKKMEGVVEIDSEEGQGTLVRIILPVKKPKKKIEEVTIAEEQPTDTLQEDVTLLIAEDNPQLRNYLSEIFIPFYRVLTAENGRQALEIASKELPEIIISDIMMPELDGLSFCKEIKENILTSDIMVILLTAKTSPEEEFVGYKYGADIYIKKPFDPDLLLHQIKNLIKTRVERKMHFLEQMASPDDHKIKIDRKEAFLNRSLKLIEDHIDDANFHIDLLAEEMGTSRSVLYKKFKKQVGQTPNQFIQAVRLKKAAELLIETDLNINEIGYAVGFNQTHYFIKCFKSQFQKTPGRYRKSYLSEKKR